MPVSVPKINHCVTHEKKRGTFFCPTCGEFFCEECVDQRTYGLVTHSYCLTCGLQLTSPGTVSSLMIHADVPNFPARLAEAVLFITDRSIIIHMLALAFVMMVFEFLFNESSVPELIALLYFSLVFYLTANGFRYFSGETVPVSADTFRLALAGLIAKFLSILPGLIICTLFFGTVRVVRLTLQPTMNVWFIAIVAVTLPAILANVFVVRSYDGNVHKEFVLSYIRYHRTYYWYTTGCLALAMFVQGFLFASAEFVREMPFLGMLFLQWSSLALTVISACLCGWLLHDYLTAGYLSSHRATEEE